MLCYKLLESALNFVFIEFVIITSTMWFDFAQKKIRKCAKKSKMKIEFALHIISKSKIAVIYALNVMNSQHQN